MSNFFKVIRIFNTTKGFNYLENGEIYVDSNISNFEIKASDGTLLKVNGVFRRQASVSSKDLIEFAIKQTEPFREVFLHIKDDNMAVSAKCEYKDGYHYNILNKNFDKSLLLEKSIGEAIKPNHFSFSEIIQILKVNGINFGYQYKNFEKIILGTRDVIALGLEPVKTMHDRLEIIFDKKKEDSLEIKNVDHFKGEIKTVKKGQIIARIIKGKRGIEGKNVKGVKLEAHEVKKIVLNLGESVRLIGDAIIALDEGMPVYIEKNHKIEVKKKYEVPLDVNIKTGNIKFNGQVVVKGNVEENFSVYGSAGVNIMGNVAGGNIKSLSNISIAGKNLRAKIESGFLVDDFNKVSSVLENLKKNFSLLKDNLNMILSNNLLKDKKLGSLVRTLLDVKYVSIEKSYDFIKNYIEPLFGNTNDLSKLFEQNILALCVINIKSIDDIDDILNVIEKYIVEIDSIFYLDSKTVLSYTQGSEVFSKGDILISSEGVYASNLISDSNIIFQDEDMILRGGYLKAKNFIKAGIVGTKSGVLTEIELLEDGCIECKEAYFNTKFKINKKSIMLEENYRDVKVYVENGFILIEGLKL